MDIDGTIANLLNKTEDLGKLYGYLGPYFHHGGDVVGNLVSEHQAALKALMSGRLPDINAVINQWTAGSGTSTAMKNSLMAFLIGYFGGGLPFIGKHSNKIQRFGEEGLKWSFISALVAAWNHNDDYSLGNEVTGQVRPPPHSIERYTVVGI